MKENIYIKSLKLGFERNSGISFNELTEELNINFENYDQKSNFIIWFYSNFYNEKGERYVTAHFVAANSSYKIQDKLSEFNTINENKAFIKGDALNKYIDYLELERTRKSSRRASFFSLIAIIVTAIGILIPYLFSDSKTEKEIKTDVAIEIKPERTLPERTLNEVIGIFQHKTSKQSENHVIVIDTLNGKYSGLYYGTEDSGEHGVFFYENSMENLKIENDRISFEVGKRDLYESNRFRILNPKRNPGKDSISGVSKGKLKYKGEITKSGIKVNCESDIGYCWKNELNFEKLTVNK